MITSVAAQAQRVIQTYPWGQVVWHVWGAPEMAPPSGPAQAENSASKPVLVLLHGGSGSWTHWVRNVQHFAQNHVVWALDIPGFGDSDLPPHARDADDLVPYVGEILQRTFDGQPVKVMGFSFGGMTAGLLAAVQPDLFERLILVGVPGLGLMGEILPMRGMQPEMDDLQQRQVHHHNLRAMMLAEEASIDDSVIDLQQTNVARDRLRRRRIAKTDVLSQVQSGWACPVHGVWGEQDALYRRTLPQVPQVLHRLDSFTVIPEAGHWVAFERPEAFHRAVDPLLGVVGAQ